jgi:hypothetical protein
LYVLTEEFRQKLMRCSDYENVSDTVGFYEEVRHELMILPTVQAPVVPTVEELPENIQHRVNMKLSREDEVRLDRMADSNETDNYVYLWKHVATGETQDQLSEWFSVEEIDMIILERARRALICERGSTLGFPAPSSVQVREAVEQVKKHFEIIYPYIDAYVRVDEGMLVLELIDKALAALSAEVKP